MGAADSSSPHDVDALYGGISDESASKPRASVSMLSAVSTGERAAMAVPRCPSTSCRLRPQGSVEVIIIPSMGDGNREHRGESEPSRRRAIEYAGDKGTTSINLVREALLAATLRQLDVSSILREARIDPELLRAPKARVPADAFARLWIGLADLLDDEFFGIDSHPMRRGSYRLLCHAVLDCDSLEQAMRRTLSFLRGVLDDIYGDLQRNGDQAWIVLHDHGVVRRLFGYGTWLILVHGLACWLVRRRIPIQELSFRAPAPLDESDYRMRFCENIHFGASVTRVGFSSSFLDLKITQTSSSLGTFLKAAPENILVKYRNEDSLSARVRRQLRGHRPDSWPGLDDLAQALNMSSSTLQRRLQEEGMSYRRLKDELRRDIAIILLSEASMTVNEVAARAGFLETSAFQRAFKKWTGVSPGAYRRTHEVKSKPSMAR